VAGTVRILKPIGTVGPIENRTGEIAINGKAYSCHCLEFGFSLTTTDTKNQPKCYELPADLSSCECMDYLSRSDKRQDGRCKHQKALAALVKAGKLPALKSDPIQQAPRVPDCTVCSGTGYRAFETEYSRGLSRCVACDGGTF
jgi:hypothetical protein